MAAPVKRATILLAAGAAGAVLWSFLAGLPPGVEEVVRKRTEAMEILEELRVDMYERTEEENKFRKEWDLVFAEYQRAAQKRTSLQSAYTLAVTPTEIEEMEKRLAAEIDDMEEDVQSMIGEWERLSVLLGDLESEWESFTSEEQKVLARNIEELGVRAEEVRGRTSALKSDLDAVNSEISQLKFDLAVAPAEKPEALLRRIRSASARREEIRKAIEATAIHAARIGHELETRTEEWDAAAGDEAKELFDRIPAVRRRRDEIQMTVWVAIGDVERARGVLERH